MKQKLFLVSELFPPEETSTGYIMGEIANILSLKYDVFVICGPAVYDKNKKLDRDNKFVLKQGINIIRVDGVDENKNSKLSRIRKFILMSLRLSKTVKKHITKEDKVFMVSNPFPLIILMGYLRYIRKFDLIMLVHDVFPEGLYTEMKLPSFVYKIMSKVFNRAYASANTIITLGRDMTDVIQHKISPYLLKTKSKERQTTIVQIENWGDIVSIFPYSQENLPKEYIVIEYAGNIGKAQGISDFVKLIERIGNEHIIFSIWGTGSESEEIENYIKEKRLTNILLNGPYFRSQQNNVLNACDLSLVTLVDGMYGLGVPSKSYNIMAAGKPILFIGDLRSEMALTIKENDIGFCFDSKDVDGLNSFLKKLNVSLRGDFHEMGMKSRAVVEQKYSKDVILSKLSQVV